MNKPAIIPELGMDSPGRYWIKESESETPVDGNYIGDLCYCKDTKRLLVWTGSMWEKPK